MSTIKDVYLTTGDGIGCSRPSDAFWDAYYRELSDKKMNSFTVKFPKEVDFTIPHGTKTVVKCSENDTYSPEMGMAMAICKKALGNKGNYSKVFKKWLPEEEESDFYASFESFKEHLCKLANAVFGTGGEDDDIKS